jgi:hypothetical protein
LSLPPASRISGASVLKLRNPAMARSGDVAMLSLTHIAPPASATISSRCGTPLKVRATVAMPAVVAPMAPLIAAAASMLLKLCPPRSRTSLRLQIGCPPQTSRSPSSQAPLACAAVRLNGTHARLRVVSASRVAANRSSIAHCSGTAWRTAPASCASSAAVTGSSALSTRLAPAGSVRSRLNFAAA